MFGFSGRTRSRTFHLARKITLAYKIRNNFLLICISSENCLFRELRIFGDLEWEATEEEKSCYLRLSAADVDIEKVHMYKAPFSFMSEFEITCKILSLEHVQVNVDVQEMFYGYTQIVLSGHICSMVFKSTFNVIGDITSVDLGDLYNYSLFPNVTELAHFIRFNPLEKFIVPNFAINDAKFCQSTYSQLLQKNGITLLGVPFEGNRRGEPELIIYREGEKVHMTVHPNIRSPWLLLEHLPEEIHRIEVTCYGGIDENLRVKVANMREKGTIITLNDINETIDDDENMSSA